MKQYEAMFLFDPTFGSSFEQCEAEIRRLLERAEAEILICRKWEERRLAYRIKGRKRGVYVLVFFKASPEKITPLERDAKLSESILRLLVLRAETMTLEAMEAAFKVASEQEPRAEDRKRSERGAGRSDKSVAPKSDKDASASDKDAVPKEDRADKPVVLESGPPDLADAKAAEEPATTD